MSWFEFPHTRTYDSDLGWLIRAFKQLNVDVDNLHTWAAEHQPEYEDLKNKVEGLIENLVDVIQPWDAGVEYHIYTMVTYQGQNYVAVQDVPIGIMITNTEYWRPANTLIEQINAIGLVTSGIQQKLFFLLSEPAGTDITEELNDALASYQYVMLDGKSYVISGTVTVPDSHFLDGSGSRIVINSDTDYAIHLGTTYNLNNRSSKRTTLKNIDIECDRHCSGILIGAPETHVTHVSINNASVAGIDIFPPDTYSAPSDANIDNVWIFTDGNPCEYGIRVSGTDNQISHVRTLSTIVGLYITGRGGGTYALDVHPLGLTSSQPRFTETVGFLLDSGCIIDNGYSDNFYIGFKITSSSQITLKNPYVYCYEYQNHNPRYCISRESNVPMEIIGKTYFQGDNNLVAFRYGGNYSTWAYDNMTASPSALYRGGSVDRYFLKEFDMASPSVTKSPITLQLGTKSNRLYWIVAGHSPNELLKFKVWSNEFVLSGMYSLRGSVDAITHVSRIITETKWKGSQLTIHAGLYTYSGKTYGLIGISIPSDVYTSMIYSEIESGHSTLIDGLPLALTDLDDYYDYQPTA